MLKESDVVIELPVYYVHDKCRDWDGLCAELGMPADCLEYGYCEPDDKVRLTLAQARQHGLFQSWQL